MADTLDILSLAEGKAAIHLDQSDATPTALPAYITAVSRRVDELIGPVVNRTYTSEAYDGSTFDRAVYRVKVKHRPVSSITTVTEYDGTTAQVLTAETNSTKTSTDYLYDSTTGFLYRRSNGSTWAFPTGMGNVTITYVAGRAASTATVDAQVKQGAAVILEHLWKRAYGAGSQTFGEQVDPFVPMGFAIPTAALELFGDLRRAPAVA